MGLKCMVAGCFWRNPDMFLTIFCNFSQPFLKGRTIKHDIWAGHRLHSRRIWVMRIGDGRGGWSRYRNFYSEFLCCMVMDGSQVYSNLSSVAWIPYLALAAGMIGYDMGALLCGVHKLRWSAITIWGCYCTSGMFYFVFSSWAMVVHVVEGDADIFLFFVILLKCYES